MKNLTALSILFAANMLVSVALMLVGGLMEILPLSLVGGVLFVGVGTYLIVTITNIENEETIKYIFGE